MSMSLKETQDKILIGNAYKLNNYTANAIPNTNEKEDIIKMINELMLFAQNGKIDITSIIGQPSTKDETFNQIYNDLLNLKKQIINILIEREITNLNVNNSLNYLINQINNIKSNNDITLDDDNLEIIQNGGSIIQNWVIPSLKDIKFDYNNNLFAIFNDPNKSFAKYDNNMNELWNNNKYLNISDLIIDSKNNIYACYNNATGVTLAKFDNNGNEIWNNDKFIDASKIKIDSNGNIFVAYSAYVNYSYNNKIAKFDNNGNYLLNIDIPYDSSINYGTFISDLVVDKNDNIIVTFHSYNYSKMVTKYDNNMNELWNYYNDTNYANCINVDYDGNIYVGYGYSDDTINSWIRLVKLDSNGNVIWCSNNNSIRFVQSSVILDKNNNIFVDNNNIELIKFDNNGNKLWRYASFYYIEHVKLDRFDNLYVVGQDGATNNTLFKICNSNEYKIVS